MKTKLLLSLLILCSSFFGNVLPVHGEPADIFKPLLDQIKKELPLGLSMRLPSYIPASDTPIYPFVESDQQGLKVNIGTRPDCKNTAKSNPCVIGVIATVKHEAVTSWPPEGSNRQRVNLDRGVSGFYFTRGKGNSKVSYIAWQQDKQTFGIAALSEITTKNELLNIAKSMTGENVITRTD